MRRFLFGVVAVLLAVSGIVLPSYSIKAEDEIGFAKAWKRLQMKTFL